LGNLSAGTRAFFQARLKRRLYTLVLEKFKEAASEGLTKAELARRTGRKPEVITRFMQTPSNWRLDTVSDLLLGICGEELIVSTRSPAKASPRNHEPHDIIPGIAPGRKIETTSTESAGSVVRVEFRKEPDYAA
jgi:hypothetical protein